MIERKYTPELNAKLVQARKRGARLEELAEIAHVSLYGMWVAIFKILHGRFPGDWPEEAVSNYGKEYNSNPEVKERKKGQRKKGRMQEQRTKQVKENIIDLVAFLLSKEDYFLSEIVLKIRDSLDVHTHQDSILKALREADPEGKWFVYDAGKLSLARNEYGEYADPKLASYIAGLTDETKEENGSYQFRRDLIRMLSQNEK